MAIIGGGDIGTAIKESGIDRNDIVFFASGVSNSGETDKRQFQREYSLLVQQDRDFHLVYFSTLSIYYAESPYVRHKKNMEACIKKMFNKYTIIRIGNITFGSNPNTLINFITNKLKSNEPFEVQQVYRHLIDKFELIYWLKLIQVGKQDIMNITGRITYVPILVNEIKASL